ncbi:MAG: penicillin-binding protein 2 [Candidatus Omnitrophica bacterium]|nr:penicillin-binding protein 2 [Candidatus Omnitrophota bacterium]
MSVSDKAQRLLFVTTALFAFLGVNLVWMQVIKGDAYRALSEKNRLRVIYLEGARGKILDRRGRVLATSRLGFNCSAIPWEAQGAIQQSCRVLAPILGEDAWTLEKRFYERPPGAFHTVLMAEDIGSQKAIAIEERLDRLPGFLVETHSKRTYPLGESAAHLVGFVGPIRDDEEDLMEIGGYKPADWVGRDGVEKFYESYLRGRSGGIQMEVNSRGRFVRTLGFERPTGGKDIRLTVDAELESTVQEYLRAQKGAVIVMNLEDGGLLSLNSSPSFDPNLFATREGRKKVGDYLTDERAPMVNRAIRGAYPPGSIFKIVTALAALEQKKITAATVFKCGGVLTIGGNAFHCWNLTGHGDERLAEGFAHSCNVYFYSAGVLAGVDAIAEKAAQFGFSKLTGIDLPGEKEGFVPSREWKKKVYHAPWYEGETANFAIGQGYLQVTPIQALGMIAGVAAHGWIFKPHVVDRIENVKVADGSSRTLTIDPSDLRAVIDGLDAVIQSGTGTGRLARVEGIRIAGKTGTAQSGQDRTHAWFVGFAPEENPKVAVVVFLENGGRGGVSAASLAALLFQWLKKASYL